MPLFERNTLALLLLLGSLASAPAAQKLLPDAIAAPGETVVLSVHAEGTQVYDCKAGADGKLAWAFREPIATLLADGKTVGRHYAGPNWEHSGGSAVTGNVADSVPGATPHDIPWLKLEVVSRRGSGILSGVTTVQRINTSGGKLEGPCKKAGAYRGALRRGLCVPAQKELSERRQIFLCQQYNGVQRHIIESAVTEARLTPKP